MQCLSLKFYKLNVKIIFTQIKRCDIMKISAIPTGKFKLDGGAMFGVVPKRMLE